MSATVDDRRSLARSTATQTALIAVSRLTGFVRVVVVAAVLGTTFLGNTYQSANTIPNIVFELFAAGALQAVLVPALVQRFDRSDRGDPERLAGSVLGFTALGLGVLVAIGMLLAPVIMGLLVSGVDDVAVRDDQIRLGAIFLWIFLPQMLIYDLGIIATAVLHARGRFALPAIAPAVNNVVVCSAYVAFWLLRDGAEPSLDLAPLEIAVLAGGTSLGVVAFCAVPVVGAWRTGFRFRPNLDRSDPALGTLARQGGWAALYLGMTQVLLAAVLVLANRTEGGVVAYQVGFTFFLLPYALFGLPVLTTLFPAAARQVQAADWPSVGATTRRGITAIALFVLPAAAALGVLSEPLSDVAMFGNVDAEGAALTARVIAGFAPGLVGYSVFYFLTRIFYAMDDTRTPAVVHAIVVGIGVGCMIAGAVVLDGDDVVTALAWSHSVTYLLRSRPEAGPAGDRPRSRSRAGPAGHRCHDRGRRPGVGHRGHRTRRPGRRGDRTRRPRRGRAPDPRRGTGAARRDASWRVGRAPPSRPGARPMNDQRVLQLLGPSTGGIRRHVGYLTERLRAEGWTVDTAGPAGVLDELTHVVDVPAGLSPSGLARCRSQLRAIVSRGGYDLVHAHGLKVGWLLSTLRVGVPTVLSVHNLVLDEVAGRSARPLRWLEGRLPARFDATIAISREVAGRFDHGPGRERIQVIPPAGPPPSPKRDRAAVRAELGLDEGDDLVVTAARLHPQKGLDLLLAAADRAREERPKLRWVIFGDGPDHDSLVEEIERRQLDSTVLLAGRRPDVDDQLAAADVVAVTSRWESGPLVVLEALALGRPVVSTRVGLAPDVVPGTAGRLVDVSDAAGFADALVATLRAVDGSASQPDPSSEASRMPGSSGQLTPPALAAQVEALYRTLCHP